MREIYGYPYISLLSFNYCTGVLSSVSGAPLSFFLFVLVVSTLGANANNTLR